MELLEYQAKELFRMVDIPILPSQTIKDSRKIKKLEIPYPVVLKSQVRSGGRGKAGGIKFVANTIDAIAAARTIFNLSILGEYPEVILAEAHYDTERELFLAIVLDYELQCPVLMGSASGGMNVNSLLANLQQVVVDDDFSLFYARRLAASMGLSGKLICSVSDIIAKMYRLFQERDLDSIEINPLGMNTRGELMALDGKITINDAALARQPIIKTFNFSSPLSSQFPHTQDWRWLDWHNQSGKIAIIANSFDRALLTWDLLGQKRVNPACGAVINPISPTEENIPLLYRNYLQEILKELESVKGLKVILINIWDTKAVSREIILEIANYLQSKLESDFLEKESKDYNNDAIESKSSAKEVHSKGKSQPKFILRLSQGESLKDLELEIDLEIKEHIYLGDRLESLISQAISLVKSS